MLRTESIASFDPKSSHPVLIRDRQDGPTLRQADTARRCLTRGAPPSDAGLEAAIGCHPFRATGTASRTAGVSRRRSARAGLERKTTGPYYRGGGPQREG